MLLVLILDDNINLCSFVCLFVCLFFWLVSLVVGASREVRRSQLECEVVSNERRDEREK